ncbi:hypothetical protein QBC33DRAFT_512224 [Phialemonium atrogriseum]|uniref:Uncharacterized protein n=1 Tax=Phialemonium atrogriseum TaxID=1093897 RepID=A0AAJ0FJZ0_9PEZI|nr:uncharacterized protein QBC33DRAFT_512224 [Phialemonium atrogriseum]KAK1770472.1 hypothetical protein QBC33DRAFT_512224 [Phialemonium atrogriseum]
MSALPRSTAIHHLLWNCAGLASSGRANLRVSGLQVNEKGVNVGPPIYRDKAPGADPPPWLSFAPVCPQLGVIARRTSTDFDFEVGTIPLGISGRRILVDIHMYCVVLQKGLAWAYTVRRGKGRGKGGNTFNMLPHPQAETGEEMVPVAAGQQQAGRNSAVRPKRRHAIIDSLVVVLQINASGGIPLTPGANFALASVRPHWFLGAASPFDAWEDFP